jgi:hypothetical protein
MSMGGTSTSNLFGIIKGNLSTTIQAFNIGFITWPLIPFFKILQKISQLLIFKIPLNKFIKK